jgi:hypothetical protein
VADENGTEIIDGIRGWFSDKDAKFVEDDAEILEERVGLLLQSRTIFWFCDLLTW